jgi:hypothetical protein
MAKSTTRTKKDIDMEDMPSVAEMMAELDAIAAERGIEFAPWESPDSAGFAETSERTRYATPGQGAGTGTVRLVSDKQVRFIKRLMAERDTTKLVRLPGSEDIERMSLAGARDLIERLLACPELPAELQPPAESATEPQLRFLAKLLAERVAPEGTTTEGLSKRGATALIDVLKKAPRKPATSVTPAAPVTEGFYLNGETVYKVQRAVHGSGNLYAKVFNPDTMKFTYATGGIHKLTAAMKLDDAQSVEFGALYGFCGRCGLPLTDDESIALGIGPVCLGKEF